MEKPQAVGYTEAIMRILITEDDRNLLEFLIVSLKIERFDIDTAKTAADACRLARLRSHDLMILDNRLPDGTAADICASVRDGGKKTPIMVISVICDVAEKVALLNAGADDYLAKPFAFDELLARIRALLRRPAMSYRALITVGPIVIDTAKRTVRRDDRQIYLTRREFELLEFLGRNRGRLVSRDLLMDQVWNEDGESLSNTVEAHVLNLRKKIGDGDRKIILNIPGRGYMLSEEL